MAEPIQKELIEMMNLLAVHLDEIINNGAKGKDKKFGFMLAIFPFGEGGRFNYISNSPREDMICLFKEMLARFEGQAEVSGNA